MPIEGFFYLQCWWWLILQHANSLVAQIRSAKCPSAPDVSFLLLAADLASGKVTNALTQQFPSVWNPKVMPELPQPWCKALKAAVPYSKQDLFQPPETQQWLGGTTVFPTKKEKKKQVSMWLSVGCCSSGGWLPGSFLLLPALWAKPLCAHKGHIPTGMTSPFLLQQGTTGLASAVKVCMTGKALFFCHLLLAAGPEKISTAWC